MDFELISPDLTSVKWGGISWIRRSTTMVGIQSNESEMNCRPKYQFQNCDTGLSMMTSTTSSDAL